MGRSVSQDHGFFGKGNPIFFHVGIKGVALGREIANSGPRMDVLVFFTGRTVFEWKRQKSLDVNGGKQVPLTGHR